MEQAKRVAKNTGFLYLRMGITIFVSLYTTRLVLAALGVDDFGIYNLVAGIVTMLVFLNAAMTSASQRFLSYAQGEGDKLKQKQVFNASIILHFVIGVVVVLLIEGVGYYLFKDVLIIDVQRVQAAKFVFHFMVISTFFTIIIVPYNAVINARENMLYEAVVGVIESILKLVIALIITYYHKDKLILYGFLMAILTILILIAKRIYCHKKYDEVDINFRKYYHKKIFNEMSVFAGWSFLGSMSSMIAFYGQGTVLNMFFGTVVNAAHGIANQVSGQLKSFSFTMLKALNPVIAKSEGAGNRQNMLYASVLGSKFSFFLMVFFYVPMYLEMPYIFKIWLKEIPPYTLIFCQLLLIQNLIEQFIIPLQTSIEAVGKIRVYQTVMALVNFIPISLSFLLFEYNFPPYYLYLSFILYAIIKFFIVISFCKKHCELVPTYFLKNVVFPGILIFLIIYSVGSTPGLLFNDSLLKLVFTVITTSICFVFVVYLVGLSKKEKVIIKQLLMNLEIHNKIKNLISYKK